MTPLGIRTAYCLFFVHLGSRKVFLVTATYHADASWMLQQARKFRRRCKEHRICVEHLIHSHDSKFAKSFDALFRVNGVREIRTPVQVPNADAFAESWVATINRECLNYFVCFGLGHLDHIAPEFKRFYNQDRPHQGVGNRPSVFVRESHNTSATRIRSITVSPLVFISRLITAMPRKGNGSRVVMCS